MSQVLSRVDSALMIEALLRTMRFGSNRSKASWIVSMAALTRGRASGSGLVGRRGGVLLRENDGARGSEVETPVGADSGDRGRQIL